MSCTKGGVIIMVLDTNLHSVLYIATQNPITEVTKDRLKFDVFRLNFHFVQTTHVSSF